MNTVDAYHLPGLEDTDIARRETREYGDGALTLRVPVLSPAGLARLADRLREQRAEHLAELPVGEVVDAVDAAAARLADPTSPEREAAERWLPATVGYSPPMARLVLDRMTAGWREGALRRLLAAELGDPEVLDSFRSRPGEQGRRRVRAYGPELALHIFAGNAPGVGVTSVVRSLLVKAATLGKTAAGAPLLPVLFARALANVAPGLAECLAVTYWPGGDEAVEASAFEHADTAVVYGGGGAADEVRARLPAGTRLVVHGPRVSFGMIGRAALRGDTVEQTARDAARAVAVFDQRGCVSPHLFYVERGGQAGPAGFAERLAAALARLEERLPRGRISAGEAARIHRARASTEFRELAEEPVRLHASAGTEHTVIYEEDPAFAPSCLNRVVRVKPVDRLGEVTAYVRPHSAVLQTVGWAGAGERADALAADLGRVGISRITMLQKMPWPPPAWHHDGRGPLRELIRWVDLEM